MARSLGCCAVAARPWPPPCGLDRWASPEQRCSAGWRGPLGALGRWRLDAGGDLPPPAACEAGWQPSRAVWPGGVALAS
eukprot:12083139-Alexandrium_andersonii.AAC.1